MITLHIAPRLWGLPSFSAPCMKLEIWLRMVELPYSLAPNVDLGQAPKGKVPFVEYKGRVIGDSALIIDTIGKAEGVDADARLSPAERGISRAFRRMLQENTYWFTVHQRYRLEENWQVYRHFVAGALMPGAPESDWGPPVDGFRQIVLGELQGHGMGRHSSDEIEQIAISDIASLADFLGDKPFFMGDTPSVVDATACAYIGNIIKTPFTSPAVEYMNSRENLSRFYDRMKERFFSDITT